MSDTAYIYTLIDPRDNKPFYVGQTNNLKKRITAHQACARDVFRHGCINTLKELRLFEIAIETGLYPIMRVVATCEPQETDEQEKFWTHLHELYGYEMMNAESKHYNRKRKERIGGRLYVNPVRAIMDLAQQGSRERNHKKTLDAIQQFRDFANNHKDNLIIKTACETQIYMIKKFGF